MKPVLTAQAAADVTEAAQWYEAKKAGLGLEFIERVEQAIERIAANPRGYAPLVEDARRSNLRQFPFGLWYRYSEDDGSIVIACLHHRRGPGISRERALGIYSDAEA